MHLAYAWIPIAFALNALAPNGLLGLLTESDAAFSFGWNPRSVALHAFTAGAMNLFIYGMISRVALGHTGRAI